MSSRDSQSKGRLVVSCSSKPNLLTYTRGDCWGWLPQFWQFWVYATSPVPPVTQLSSCTPMVPATKAVCLVSFESIRLD